ncbi:MAG: hypothetical protein IPM82_07445 [Saprospiraceae bacterium]|nr:hypothetical protein [Saprospiraceae bacterium]
MKRIFVALVVLIIVGSPMVVTAQEKVILRGNGNEIGSVDVQFLLSANAVEGEKDVPGNVLPDGGTIDMSKFEEATFIARINNVKFKKENIKITITLMPK